MAYKALYRTYRPQKFSEVIGQGVIVKTLQNAIKNDRVSHAYLFCGPRGTGKTSIARIFAKVLNCSNVQDGEPCDNCETCKEISEGVCPDVIEIDAASNNGVDEIRELKDKVKFLPAGSKYKIYIIDEVHMLSTSAFNALLKTLEEPPKHVIFILATTEPQKVLSTIISRCQRFDFGALNVNELTDALENICIKEEIDYDKNALKIIAGASEGGLRDAISLLDQAISLTDEKIDEAVASAVTGLLEKEKLIELANAIEDKNISECLLTIQELQNSGKEVSKIVNSLLGFYRDILLCKSINASFNDEYVEFAKKIDLRKVYYNIDALSNVQARIRYGNATGIYLEVAIIKMISVTKEELDYSKRIEALEAKLEGGVSVSSESSSNIDVEDIKRLRILEGKFNNLLTELSKLELPKNLQLLRELSEKNDSSSNSNAQFKELNNKLDQALEDVAFLKVTQQSFRNELNNTKSGEVDESLLSAKIEEVMKKSKANVDIDEIKEYVNEALANNGSTGTVNNEEFNELFKELEKRVSQLESNLYKMLAGKLSPQVQQKKTKSRVNERQISLWNNEIVDVEKVSNQEISAKTDFQELSNDTEKEVSEPVYVEPMEEKETVSLDEIKESELASEEKEPEEVTIDDVNEETEDEIVEINEENDVNFFGETEFSSNEDEVEPTKEAEADTSWYSESEAKEEAPVEEVQEENIFDTQEEISKEEPIELEEKEPEEVTEEFDTSTPVEEELVEEETKAEETLEVAEEQKEESKPQEPELDEFERYDVKVLERIMNDSFCKDYLVDRDRLANIWKHLTTLAPIDKRGVAELLAEGEIKAVGNHEFVIIYNNALLCNKVMSRKFKAVSLKLLAELLNSDFNYLALTRDIWTAKRAEYASQYFIGTKHPTLTPFNDPNLKVSIDDSDEDDERVKNILDLFGTDVTIKKE